jgi:serine/threonine protein phosphatase PrpC
MSAAISPRVEAQPEPDVSSLDLSVAMLTNVGRMRRHNEDYVDGHVPADPDLLERKGALFLVADGMGGHQAGEVASRGAVEQVIDNYYADNEPDAGKSLVRAVWQANQHIQEQAQVDPDKAGMGTTLVAAAILGTRVYIANVGDSRAYLIDRAGIHQITEDHSWVEEQVRAGLLTREQAQQHPQRNLVTRALGSRPTVEVDLFEGELREGDVLLLCSDGLTNQVEDLELEAAVRECRLQDASTRLVAKANERGGTDNISLLLVGHNRVDPVATGTEPSRRFPWLPVFAGVALLLALLAAGLVVIPRLRGYAPGAAILEQTPTLTVELATEALPTATRLAPGSTSPTSVPASTEGEPAAPVGVTLTPAGAREPTSAQGETVPTETLAPTLTATAPPPTGTTEPTTGELETASPVPATAMPEATYSPPALVAPLPRDAGSLHGQVTFAWRFAGELDAGDGFQVLIWKGDMPHNGAAEFVRRTQQVIDLDRLLPTRGGQGEYLWSVIVVDMETGDRLSPEASPWQLTYIGPQEREREESPPLQLVPTAIDRP